MALESQTGARNDHESHFRQQFRQQDAGTMQQMRRLRRELRSRSCCRRVAEPLRILLPKLLPPLVSSNLIWSQSGTAGIHGSS
jgi:hypothetical protein